MFFFRYYDFDDAVIRELLGKKLSSRHRKDLDEVSEKTGVVLRSCRYEKSTELNPLPPSDAVQKQKKIF